jgi:glycerol-3-phosphate dehydrogenase
VSHARYDVVIIGGGINGAGVAQAAAARGYRTLLLEKNSRLAGETSSRSSKLIHGGLRYLESLEFSLVRESLHERELLLRLAPELVHLEKFNIPVYKNTKRSALTLHIGLSCYSLLAGLQNQHFYRQLKPADWGKLDELKTKDLKTVFQYYDAQTDDVALTLSVMASALTLGAELQCDAEFIDANIEHDTVSIQYRQSSLTKTVDASVIINASGPWVYSVNERIRPQTVMAKPDLVQGTHLVVERPVSQAYYLEAPQDGRVVFLLPWKSHALLGTTEHLYRDDPAEVHMLQEEQDYLLEVYNYYFPTHEKTVLQTMTGCRVLPAAADSLFRRSRETHFEVDDKNLPRMLAIVGGKLTVYRHTADKVMKILARSLPAKKTIADTAELSLMPVD